MRTWLAIIVCKALRFAGRLLGRGSSLPGLLALKICPDILRRVQLPACIIAVSGSNGKTSTVEMIAAIFRAAGKTVVYNKEGSNQTEGVATLVLGQADWRGRVKADVLLLESDERYAARSFRWFHPTAFVITNLYRDQLTRNGHPESVFDALRPAIFPETTLVLNADDPLVSCFGREHEKTVWFGLDQVSLSAKEPSGVYRDGSRCPVCRGAMVYDCYHYNHIGHYRCTACGHHRPKTDDTVTALDLAAGSLTINGDTEIRLALRSIYNVYNILAAFSVCRLGGVPAETAAGVINDYILKNGRMQTFRLGGHRGTLLTSKHENSVAYDTNLRYVRAQNTPCTVVVIVDAVSRKYFCGDTSWLWDIDFDQLNCPQVKRILLCGRHVHDLAVRFAETGISLEKVALYEKIPDACALLAGEAADSDEPVYVITCFSDRDKFMSLTQAQ